MTRVEDNSRGGQLARRLRTAVNHSQRLLRDGARDLPKLHGVTQQAVFKSPMENVLTEAGEILEQTECVYNYGNTFVLASGEGSDGRLTTLATDGKLEQVARGKIANLMICESPSSGDRPPSQFAATKSILELVVNHEPTQARLPEIKVYAKRPVFDSDYRYLDGGWYADVGYLIHCPVVDPVPFQLQQSADPRENIPPTLLQLVGGFLFKSEIDLVNAIGVFLTSLLANLFISTGKAIVLLDGNQPEVGKTLLARTLGVVTDGAEPDLIRYDPKDEELEKRICAGLRSRHNSLILIDNAKVKAGTAVSSPVIEAQSVAPEIRMRILGVSSVYERPNDLIWALTMNNTQVSADIMSRSVPIQFAYDGDPAQNDFGGFDPIAFAKENRLQILAELAGMVIYWTQQGRPEGNCRHRLRHWASTIGGILETCGLRGFLSNVSDLRVEFDNAADQIAALAESALMFHPD